MGHFETMKTVLFLVSALMAAVMAGPDGGYGPFPTGWQGPDCCPCPPAWGGGQFVPAPMQGTSGPSGGFLETGASDTPGAFPYPMGRDGPMGWNGPDCCPCPPPASPAKWISPHDEGPFGTGRQGFLEVASKNPSSLELWKANSKMMHNMLEEREAKLRK